MVAETRNDDEVTDLDSDDDEGYWCLMAKEDSNDDDVNELSYDKPPDVYAELQVVFESLLKRNQF